MNANLEAYLGRNVDELKRELQEKGLIQHFFLRMISMNIYFKVTQFM